MKDKKTIEIERRRIQVKILGIPILVMRWTETVEDTSDDSTEGEVSE